jgi:hypothetical protein
MLVSNIFVGSHYNQIDQQYEESTKALMACFTSKKCSADLPNKQ